MINKWDIYLCQLSGKSNDEKSLKPVLVISNNAVNHTLSLVTVLPISLINKGDKVYPTEISLPAKISQLSKESVVMVQQIQTIPQSKMEKKLTTVEDQEFKDQIKQALMNYFEMDEE